MTYLRDGPAGSLSPDTRTVTAKAAALLLSEIAKRGAEARTGLLRGDMHGHEHARDQYLPPLLRVTAMAGKRVLRFAFGLLI